MSIEIRDYKIREIACVESNLQLIKEFIEKYEKHVRIEVRDDCILIQTPVNGGKSVGYSNTVGMDFPPKDNGYLYVNPISYKGKSVMMDIHDFILYDIPRLHQQNVRENKLGDLLN